MNTKLIEGLKKMDVANDGHWTKEGSPTLAVLAVFASRKVSSDELEKEAPGFNRETAATYFDKKVEEPVQPIDMAENAAPGGEQTAQAGVATAEPVQTPAAPEAATAATAQSLDVASVTQDIAEQQDISELEAVNILLEQADDAIARLSQERDDIVGQLGRVNVKRDELLARREKLTDTKGEQQNTITSYLKAQQQQRQLRADQITKFRDSGLTLKMVNDLLPKKAPIDQMLQGKRK